MKGRFDIIFLVIVSVATYAYVVFALRKTPDYGLQYGISLNAMLAFGLTGAFSVYAFIFLLIAGTLSYFIVAVLFPPIIFKVIKKIISEDKTVTTI
jgi:hypothetical protein